MLRFAENFNPQDVPPLRAGNISISPSVTPKPPSHSNMGKDAFVAAVEVTKEHIRAGDIFQLVLSHRFERSTFADPFEVYRSLRIVNPSPYMAYMQVRGSFGATSTGVAVHRNHDWFVRACCYESQVAVHSSFAVMSKRVYVCVWLHRTLKHSTVIQAPVLLGGHPIFAPSNCSHCQGSARSC